MSLSDVKALSNEYSRPEETFFNSFCVLRISRRHIFFSKSTCNNVFVPVDLNFVYPGKQKYNLWDPFVTSHNECQIL